MQDRTPTYPGRVTLTPVTGQDNTYDMAMADQPSAVGTPLNKASLLDDTVAAAVAAIEASATPDTPNEALALLAAAFSGRAKIETGSYTGTGTYGTENRNSLTFGFAPKLLIIYHSRYASNISTGITQFMIMLSACDYAANYELQGTSYNNIYPCPCRTVWNGNSVAWYNSNTGRGVSGQMNVNGYTYNYVAIG